jgi:hypothetical protein
MPFDRLLAATERNAGRALAKLGHELLHPRPTALVLLAWLHVRLENGHERQRIAPIGSSLLPPRPRCRSRLTDVKT